MGLGVVVVLKMFECVTTSFSHYLILLSLPSNLSQMHERYADAYALLLSRATRLAIDELSAGRKPPEPPKPKDIDLVLNEDQLKSKDEPSWNKRTFYL